MKQPSTVATERFGQVYSALLGELDWELLEGEYCEGEADGFFGAEAVDALSDASLKFAGDLLERLEPGGKSLYLGPGVAELGLLLAESILLERQVWALRLDDPETRELNRALAKVEADVPGGSRTLPRLKTRSLDELSVPDCDHLWFVSVATDPVAFPALHALAYGTKKPKRKAMESDRETALTLMEDALTRTSPRAQVHTSEEERELLEAAVENLGRAVDWELTGRLSPVVGDVVRAGRLRALH